VSGRSFRAVRSALLIAVALVVLAAPAAQAAPKGVVGAFGAGDFGASSPRGVAVNETSGDVYAVDGDGDRILRYSSTGTLLSEIGAGGESSANGRFNNPNHVAVDQADGSLWVVDSLNLRVQRFDPLDAFGTHPFDRALGWDVIDGGGTDFEVCLAANTCKAGVAGTGDGQFGDIFNSFAGSAAVAPGGDVYVSDPSNHRVQRFDGATGAYEAQFGFGGPMFNPTLTAIAADANGILYVVDRGNDRVLRCHSTGGAPEGFACTAFASTEVNGKNVFSVAVDRDSGHVFVGVRPPVDGVFQDFEWPIQVLELEPDGDLVDRHLETSDVRSPVSEFELETTASVAVNSATDTIYLSLPGNAGDGVVVILGDPPGPPSATLDTTTGVTATSATFNGAVNPGGGPTGYRFEYRIGSARWTRVPAGDGALGSGATDVPVTETVTGLEPNTTYQVRLVANRTYGTDDVVTPVQTFTTDDAPPEIGATRASADDTTATLDARIDAQGSPTTYWFEYGTDTSYGQETPERDGGDGIDPVRRYETVTGLQPNTTYHFRAVAQNAAGTVEGPDRTFTTDATATPPSGRAYELVSPAGGVAEVRNASGALRPATPDGNHVCVVSPFAMAGAEPTGGTLADDVYCMHRSQSGWSTEWVSRPRGSIGVPITAAGSRFRLMTPDGSRVLFSTQFKGLVPGRPVVQGDEGFDGYLRSGGATTWVTPSTVDPFEDRPPLAASDDLEHIVFTDDGRVHEWTAGGARVVSVDEGGTPQDGVVNVDGGGVFDSGTHAVPGTISRDGSRIFFQSSAALTSEDTNTVPDIYMRENGTTTRLLSPRSGAGPHVEAVEFAGASADGDVVYLRTHAALTADAITGAALYRYDVSSEDIELVEDGIERSLGVSGDGSTVVFAGTNVLSGSDGLSLYAADEDGTVRIGPLAADDVPFFSGENLVGAPDHAQRGLRIRDDGDVIVYNAEADTPGTVGVYRWTEDGGLEVVSADRDGTKVAAIVGTPYPLAAPGLKTSTGRGMTDDGESVFFETEEALDTRDVNSAVDVYEWRDGRTRLVSPGREGDANARYLDNSADGGTVFFTTYERILPRQDINHARDLYAARRGGGFPEPPASTIGDPPAVPPGGSEPPRAPQSEGEGDQVDDPRPTLAVARPKAAALRAAARSGRLPLRMTLTGGGRITVRATAVLGGKRQVVARGSRRVRRAGRTTATVTLRLSNAARRALRRRGRLRLRIEVVGSRAVDDAQLNVVLRNAKGGR
jgi:hypothetical protein